MSIIDSDLPHSIILFDGDSQRYLVDCGTQGTPPDGFPYSDKHWRSHAELKEAFDKKISQVNFFRGLVLKDKQGFRWMPELKVVLRSIR
jgi:hypothetical protein